MGTRMLSLNINSINEEFGFKNLHYKCSKARLRAFLKYPSLNTIITHLSQNPKQIERKFTWAIQTKTWITKNLNNDGENEFLKLKIYITSHTKSSGTKLLRSKYKLMPITREDFTNMLSSYNIAFGLYLWFRCRNNIFLTTQRFIAMNMISPLNKSCPFCSISGITENIIHLFFFCRYFSKYRIVNYSNFMLYFISVHSAPHNDSALLSHDINLLKNIYI
jgi:hypothetical protein